MQQDNFGRPAMTQAVNDLGRSVSPMDERTKNLLGRALKSHYDDLVTAPIPDRFLMLLAELEAKEVRDE
jgi:hypothetical protein